ncbi:MAG: sugar phosphate isomerase/epimerase [Acidobacteriaceae bacterium]
MKSALSRRGMLLGGAAVALGGTSLARAAAGITAETGSGAGAPIQLGLASYTFRNFRRAQLIGFMKELNLQDLNAKDAKDHLPMDPAAEAQALADYKAAGIRLHAAGTISLATDTDDDMRGKFEYLKRAGIGVMVAGDPTPEDLPRVEKFVKEYDIRVAIHNHGPEDKRWHSPFDVLKAVHGMDARIGCCIDVGHAVRAGANIVEAIHAVGPRLFNMHMKDLTDFHDKDSQVAVGDGKMPVHHIFEALMAIRYKGFVDLEYEVHADDPMPGVTKSFAYMRGVLAGMGYPAAG